MYKQKQLHVLTVYFVTIVTHEKKCIIAQNVQFIYNYRFLFGMKIF